MSILLALLTVGPQAEAAPIRPYPDEDPMWVDADENNLAEKPEEYWSGLYWDGADQLIFQPLHKVLTVKLHKQATNVNSWDEVPDSSWFTNRIGVQDLSPERVARGACPETVLDPDAGEKWVVKAAKPNGANPGFIIQADDGAWYLLKMDGHDKPERATTADVFGSKVYWAAGYHTPCNMVIEFDADIFEIDDGAETEDEEGNDIPMEQHHIDEVLSSAVKLENGRLRASASKFIDGRPWGPWTYQGVRKDDPNDLIPHEDRREIRGNRILSAWLNHFDSREQNTLSAWMEQDGRGWVRHYYIDWGDCLGSSWVWAPDLLSRRFGKSYYFDPADVMVDLAAFGVITRPWETVRIREEAPILGFYDAKHFDPDGWKGGYPNPRLRSDGRGRRRLDGPDPRSAHRRAHRGDAGRGEDDQPRLRGRAAADPDRAPRHAARALPPGAQPAGGLRGRAGRRHPAAVLQRPGGRDRGDRARALHRPDDLRRRGWIRRLDRGDPDGRDALRHPGGRRGRGPGRGEVRRAGHRDLAGVGAAAATGSAALLRPRRRMADRRDRAPGPRPATPVPMTAWLAMAGLALAQQVAWSEDWRKFGAEHAVLTGSTVVTLSAFSIVNPEPRARWDRPILLDAPAAEALGAPEAPGARRAARISDGLALGLIAYPMSEAAVVGLFDDTNGLSTQWALIGTQSIVLSTVSNRIVATASGRVRPYVARCEVEPGFVEVCDSPDRYRSFFSGHTALAFTGASLTCVNHAYVEPFGGPWDEVACGASLTAATTVATLRMVAHRHYFSDVFVGAVVGAGFGAGLPIALHYSRPPRARSNPAPSPQRRISVPAFQISGRL